MAHRQSNCAAGEGTSRVLTGMTRASMRGFLVALLVAMPSIMLPGEHTQSPELVTLAALMVGGFVFAEYMAPFPSFLEFRDAPPLNRTRFIALASCLCLICVLFQHPLSPTGLSRLVTSLGSALGRLLDFPFSPVRLVQLLLPEGTAPETARQLRDMTALAYFVSLLSVLACALLIRAGQWPLSNGPFNVWINLPLFDPTTGGDVVARLHRDARLHMASGVLAPFALPAMIQLKANVLDASVLDSPQLMVWCVTGWAMFPAMMIMRGLARQRIADLIVQKRRSFAPAETLQTV